MGDQPGRVVEKKIKNPNLQAIEVGLGGQRHVAQILL
jgi:hypothetical protein